MNPSDKFSGMTAFVTAAQCQSFSAAARQLQQTPSAVSKSVSRLELDLGVKLFHRSPRLVSLTQDGEAFYERCKDLLSTAEDARSVISQQNQGGKGHLRVCLPISFGQVVVAPKLNKWLKQNEGITVEVVLSDHWVDLVQERFDIAIRFNEVPDSRLIAKPLPTPVFMTVASPEYLTKHGQPSDIGELSNHNCLGYIDRYTNQIRPWLFKSEHYDKPKHLRHRPLPYLSSDQGSFLMNHAVNGGGIMHGPDYLLYPEVLRGTLKRVLTQYTSSGPEWNLVYSQQRHTSIKLQKFVTFIQSIVS
jgi:DNA-binding transcriptional LysR family regulator